MLSLLVGSAALLTTVAITKKLATDTASNIWERLSFSVPAESFKVQLGLTSLLTTANLKIANQNNIAVKIAGLGAILKYENAEGALVEVVRTEPNNKTWTIGARQSSLIEGIQVKVSTFSAFKAGKAAISKPEGKRLLISFFGDINGLPLSYDYWY